jgi:ABC-type multidrug transport system fused ATPase/permease subunit
MEAVIQATRIANIHDFITDELPQGYDTEVGERGVRLSGGQTQRIGIARALYNDPDLLILDEGTSALDTLTERAVMDAINDLANTKTIIVIAHRLSTVQECDNILVVGKGKLTASGTYSELIKNSEKFSAMAGK